MMWYPQHPQISVKSNILLLRAVFLFIFVDILLTLIWGAKKTTELLHDGRDYYPVQKLKQLEMGRAGSEMKRESNLGTGWWFRIQWIEAMFVWTALRTTRRNKFKNITCIFDKPLWYCCGDAHGVQTSIALVSGKTEEGILTLGPTTRTTTTSHPGNTWPPHLQQCEYQYGDGPLRAHYFKH